MILRSEKVTALLVLTAVTLLCRAWIIGNPIVNIDEQFYLFVGDRMLHGQLPYIEIWDRKPIGLFLIYALAALLPNPVIAYQIMASAVAWATSLLIFRAARRYASFWAAMAAAAAYPAWLNVFAGIGGQSPVFYNLPMLIAALWMVHIWRDDTSRPITLRGCAIMLLVGMAMQIKYTALFEGLFFGICLIFITWQRCRNGLQLIARSGIWVSCALLPTLAAWAWFALIGHNNEFVQANFLSVLSDNNDTLPALGRLAGLLAGLVPLGTCAWFAWRRRDSDSRHTVTIRWMTMWFGASLAGLMIFGNWNDHYILPLLLPLCLLAAAGFDRIKRSKMAMAIVFGLGLIGGTARAIVEWQMSGSADQAQRLFALVQPHVHSHCLYVNEELSYLYRLTSSCLPTRFTFPQHLTIGRYAKGLGVNQIHELQRVLDSRPDVIVMSTIPDEDTRWETRKKVLTTLETRYHKIGTQVTGKTPYEVYVFNGQ